MSFERPILVIGLLLAAATAGADEPPAASPSDEFLEYLGSWEGNEEDWLTVGRDVVPPEERKESGRQSGQDGRTADREQAK